MAKVIKNLNIREHVSFKRIDNLTVVKLEIVMITLMTIWFISHHG